MGYLELSEKGLILEANLTAAGLLGVGRGSLAGKALSHFVLSEDQDAYYSHRQLLLKTRTPRVCELRMLRAGAAPFWARMEAATAKEAGGPLTIRAVISDVTERKQEKEAPGESEEQFRQLAEEMPDGVLVGQRGRLVYVNSAAVLLLRAAGPEELLGRNVFANIDPSHHRRARQRMQRARAGGKLPPFEDRLVRLDGSFVPVEIAVSLFRWRTKPAVRFVVRDITERKRTEGELRES